MNLIMVKTIDEISTLIVTNYYSLVYTALITYTEKKLKYRND